MPVTGAQRPAACRPGLEVAKTCGVAQVHAALRLLQDPPHSLLSSARRCSIRRGTARTLAAATAPPAPAQSSSAAPVLKPELAELCGGLPIADVLPDVLRSLRDAPSLVLQADPGAGKTTVIPLALLVDQPPWLPATSKILARTSTIQWTLYFRGRCQGTDATLYTPRCWM